MSQVETLEIKSRLSTADQIAVRSMLAEDKKLLQRTEDAFKAYDVKMDKWINNPTSNPKPTLPNIIKVFPYLKKFEGGVKIVLWPWSQTFNRLTGEQDTVPAEWLDIKQDGYLPKTFDEAQRLLILARMPNHLCGIVTEERKEMAPDVRAAETQTAKLREELTKTTDELAEAKATIEAMKAGKK